MAKDRVEIEILTETKKAIASLKSFALGIGAVIGVAKGLFSAFTGNITAWNDQEKAQAKMMGTLKATGNTIGITTKSLHDLANQMQKTTVYGDEMVMNASALLLTFRNVNKDIFPETIRLAGDMASTFGMDLNAATMQLGKALQEPIQGIGALSRVGVTFSVQQKALIKGFVETNQIAKAQAIIMEELGNQVGGVAAAMAKTGAGTFARLKNEVGDLQETLGEATMKALTPLAESLTKFINTHKGRFAAIVANFPQIFALSIEQALVVGRKLLSWENMKRLFFALADAIRVNALAGFHAMVKVAAGSVKLLIQPFVSIGQFLGKVFKAAWGNFVNFAADAMDSLRSSGIGKFMEGIGLGHLIPDIKRATDTELPKVGEAIDSYINDQLKNAVDYGTSIVEFIKVAGQTALDAGKNIGAVFSDLADPELTKKILALTEPLEAVLVDVPQRAVAPAEAAADAFYSIADAMETVGGQTATSIDPITAAMKRLDETTKEVATTLEDTLAGAATDGLMAVGEALINTGDAAETFKGIMKSLMSSVMQALAKEAFVYAAFYLAMGRWGKAAAMAAVGAGALVAAGVIQAMAEGGIVTSPTLALIGEAGPEAVIPLSKGGGMGGGLTQNVTVQGSIFTKEQLFEEMFRYAGIQQRGRR